ncbi:MAG: DUF1214 domain-containing protein [Pseudomonadales bacterium]
MTDNPSAVAIAWQSLVDNLAEAGSRMEAATRALSAEERADGFRALARALSNQLGRLEVDDASPELAPFNLWRQKFYMDNPDCLYWVAEIARGGCYRIDGVARNAVFTSVNVYAGSSLEAQTVARITTDELECDADGRFTLTLGGDPDAAAGQWVEIPAGANLVWVRQFYDQPEQMDGSCAITRLDDVPAPPIVEVERFAKRLGITAATIRQSSKVLARGAESEAELPNAIREWSEMQGGAVYTEPGIHYQRGAWQLEPGQALVIEGAPVAARHCSVLLYSRFLNSLDYRNRTVSLTGPRVQLDNSGRFRIVLAGEDPGVANWLDTEGRRYGHFVIRWLQPASTPALPTVRVVDLAALTD